MDDFSPTDEPTVADRLGILQRLATAPQLGLDATAVGCDIARLNYDDARKEHNRYKTLMFIASCAVLALSVDLAFTGDVAQAQDIGAYIGTAFTGAAAAAVWQRVNDARKERDEASAAATTACP